MARLSLIGCAKQIRALWTRSRADTQMSTIELACVVRDARHRLPHGEWSALWRLKGAPFSKRHAERYIVVSRLEGLNATSLSRLPRRLSILYNLAQLDRGLLKRLIRNKTVHPELTLREAKELVAKDQGRQRNSACKGADANRRMKNFRKFLEDASEHWSPEERISMKVEILEWVELVGGPRGRRDKDLSAVTKAPVRSKAIPGESIPPGRGGQAERTGKRDKLVAFPSTTDRRKASSTSTTWAVSRLGKGKQKVSES